MLRLDYAPRAFADLERLVEFLLASEPAQALETYELIESALTILPLHPWVGRAVSGDLRELVISRGRTGYLALYRVDEAKARVLVLAIRHQREAGFSGA